MTVASQPLDRMLPLYGCKSSQSRHEPPFQAPITLMKQKSNFGLEEELQGCH